MSIGTFLYWFVNNQGWQIVLVPLLWIAACRVSD